MLSPDRTSGIDGYVVLGRPVEEGRVEIPYEDARQIKELVTSEYFELVSPQTSNLSRNVTKIKAGKSIQDDVMYDKEIILGPSTFAGAILRSEAELSWQLLVLMSSYKNKEPGQTAERLQSYYNFTVVDQNLVRATKKIKIIRGMGSFSQMRTMPDVFKLRDDMLLADMEMDVEKIKFEQPIRPGDCRRISLRLTKVMDKIKDNS